MAASSVPAGASRQQDQLMKLRPVAWLCACGCAAAVMSSNAMAQSRDVPPPNGSSPGTPPIIVTTDVVPEIRANVMGGPGARRFSAAELAKSFIEADVNRDGELTREEARRLAIRPYSFEEMDVNRDGVISRFEYEEATR
jgi:hypothetical protein